MTIGFGSAADRTIACRVAFSATVNSTMMSSSAFGNGTVNDASVGTTDLDDGNGATNDFVPPSDDDTWSRNSFGTADQSCIP